MGIVNQVEILILDMGRPPEKIYTEFGGFGQWFKQILEKFQPEPLCTIVPVTEYVPGSFRKYSGIIITGAVESVTDDLPYKSLLIQEYTHIYKSGVPVLGVCFGHQMLNFLAGGVIERNLRGIELGSAVVTISPEETNDPLFSGLSSPLEVYEIHFDEVRSPGKNAIILAGNDHCPIQATALSESIRTVQFHPEVTFEMEQGFIADQAEKLAGSEKAEFIKKYTDPLKKSDTGEQILHNFYTEFVLKCENSKERGIHV